MPRTTLNLDGSVLDELRRRSERESKSIGQVASEVLAGALAGSPDTAVPPFEWKARDLGVPRVDLEDKEALRAVLDES